MNDPTHPRMTDQAPELLPGEIQTLEHLADSMGFGRTHDVLRKAVARLTRPTPAERPIMLSHTDTTIFKCSLNGCQNTNDGCPICKTGSFAERPVPQVREALIEYVSALRQHQIDPETRDELLNFIMAHVTSARPSDAAVAWRYRHKDTEGWSMLKNGRDPTEWLKQWPNTEYEVEALAPMRPEAADEIERLRNQLVKARCREDIYRAIEANVRSEPDRHFIDRRWLVGVNDAVDAILALSDD